MDFWGSPFWPNARRVIAAYYIVGEKRRKKESKMDESQKWVEYSTILCGRVQSCQCSTTSIWRISHRIKASERNSLDHNDDTLLYTAVHTAHTLLHILSTYAIPFFCFSKAIYLQYYRFSPRTNRARVAAYGLYVAYIQTCVCAKGSRHK